MKKGDLGKGLSVITDLGEGVCRLANDTFDPSEVELIRIGSTFYIQMQLKEKLFLLLLVLNRTLDYNDQASILEPIQDILETSFDIYQKKELLNSEESEYALKLLQDVFENFKCSISLLVSHYFDGNHMAFLKYRSGLQFLTSEWNKIAEDVPVYHEYMNKIHCKELTEDIKEFDEILQSSSREYDYTDYAKVDMSGIPKSHIWWDEVQ